MAWHCVLARRAANDGIARIASWQASRPSCQGSCAGSDDTICWRSCRIARGRLATLSHRGPFDRAPLVVLVELIFALAFFTIHVPHTLGITRTHARDCLASGGRRQCSLKARRAALDGIARLALWLASQSRCHGSSSGSTSGISSSASWAVADETICWQKPCARDRLATLSQGGPCNLGPLVVLVGLIYAFVFIAILVLQGIFITRTHARGFLASDRRACSQSAQLGATDGIARIANWLASRSRILLSCAVASATIC